MRTVLYIAGILGLIVLICGIGLNIKPSRFPGVSLIQNEIGYQPIPDGLPVPVERFYRTIYGEKIPVIETVMIVGRGRIRPFGIWLPARFVFVHNAGRDYRHYFEATFFGLPFLKVDEGYINGKSFFESPVGSYTDDPNTNQGANLALWAEGTWFPSIWVTDPRVSWQAVDDHTAILHVPFESTQESIVVRFDPETGLVDLMEAMRYRSVGDQKKILWITNEVKRGELPAVGYATWLDTGKPWAEFSIDEIQFNLQVEDYILQRGY